MIGDPVLERSHAPAADRDDQPMVTVTQSVPCERCGRTVRVALSSLRPPSFDQIDEQVECPEIQERQGEGGLLLMMCSSLKRSLDAGCASVEVNATPQNDGDGGQVVCRIPGISSTYYSPDEARGRAEIWDAHGHNKLAARLRAAAVKAERQPVSRARVAIGLGAMIIVVAGGWFALVREPAPPPLPPPAPQQLSETSDASPGPAGPQGAPDTAVLPAAPTATEAAPVPSRDPPPGAVTRSLSSEAAQSQAVEPLPPTPSPSPSPSQDAAIADATPPADAAPAAASTATASSAPAENVHLPELVMIPGGTFAMGGVEVAELPVHQVTIKPFALGKFPVTVGEWKECVADKGCPDIATGPDDNPVTNVSYDDANAYLAWLSRVVGKPFRLPSEAEWEYAARAGKPTKYWWGDQMRVGMANCKGCNDAGDPVQLLKIGSFQANPFGLFDMSGGVDQWVADSWHKNYQGAPADGSAWADEEGFARVIRSGSWKNDASYARAGSRDHYDARIRYPTHGFRVALSL
jgi:formylglycine-generating enzyme required for sulfatase activity